MRNLVPIGRFAALCRVTHKTLRHYDELDLIKPARIDTKSGYRYYDLAQAVHVERVRELRSLEMPLEEIRCVLEARDAVVIRVILERHREHLEDRLAEANAMLGRLNELLEQGGFSAMEAKIRNVSEQWVLIIRTRTSLTEIGNVIHGALEKLYGYLHEAGAAPAGPPLTLYFDEDAEKEDDLEIGVCVPIDQPIIGRLEIACEKLPAENVACALHTGPFENLPAAYSKLLSWIEQNGYELAGPAREAYLVKGNSASENRTEIMWPIQK